MSLLSDVAKLAAALNVVLLVSLLYVWVRNYLQFRSKHTLGLSIFAVLLLLQNALTVYYYLWDPTLSIWFESSGPRPLWQAMMIVDILEMVGLAFLAWVTYD